MELLPLLPEFSNLLSKAIRGEENTSTLPQRHYNMRKCSDGDADNQTWHSRRSITNRFAIHEVG